MNFETLLLRSLFCASVLVCAWMLAAMMTAKPVSSPAAAHHTVAVTAVAMPNNRSA
jgi:hypothetical protein